MLEILYVPFSQWNFIVTLPSEDIVVHSTIRSNKIFDLNWLNWKWLHDILMASNNIRCLTLCCSKSIVRNYISFVRHFSLLRLFCRLWELRVIDLKLNFYKYDLYANINQVVLLLCLPH